MADKLFEKFSSATNEEKRELLLKNFNQLSVQDLVELFRNMKFENILELIDSFNGIEVGEKAEIGNSKLLVAVVELIKITEDSKKIIALDIFHRKLNSSEIASVIDTMVGVNRVKALERMAYKISSTELINIIKNMVEEEQVEILEVCQNNISDYVFSEIIKVMSQSNKLERLRQFQGRLLIKDAVEIIKTMTDTDKLEALMLYKNNLNNQYKAEIIQTMQLNNRVKVVELYSNLLGSDGLIEVIETMGEDEKKQIIDFCKNKLEKLELYQEKIKNLDIEESVKDMEDVDKLEILELAQSQMLSWYIVGNEDIKNKRNLLYFKKKLEKLDMEEIIITLEDKNKLEVLKRYRTLLDSYSLSYIIETLDEDYRIEAITLCKNTLYTYSIIGIIRSMNSHNQLKILKLYQEDFVKQQLIDLIYTLEDAVKLEALKVFKDKFDCIELSDTICNMEHANQLKALELFQQELGSKGIARIINSMDESSQLEVLKIYKDTLSIPEELTGINWLLGIIINTNDERKIKIFDECNIDIRLFGSMIRRFDEYSEEVKTHIKQCLNAFGCKNPDIELTLRIVEKLRIGIYKEEEAKLLSEESKSFFGEETIYSLFKYFIFNGETINIEEVLEKPELFGKYQEFRKTFLEEKQIQIMETRDAISEFDGNSVLLEDCMKSELSSEEEILLKGILSERNKKISQQVNSKSELSKFPERRKEKIEELIASDSQDALIYLLTGMSKEEYYDKLKFYIGNKQIDAILEEFGEKEIDFVDIKAVNEMINYVSQMTVENRRKTLKIWNEDLSKEFENADSSVIARVRSTFHNADIKIRKLYGKELRNSLTKEELPKAIQDENDEKVSIIKLDDKDKKFNLLIHGLNAYGLGASSFEKREIGKAYICTSLISENHLGRAKAKIYYGFRNISSNSLALEGDGDIFSEGSNNSFEISARHNVKFSTAKKLLDESGKRYNEVVLWREYIDDNGESKDITPDYIVCFDNITAIDRDEAKRLNIPIVFIDSKVYERNEVERDEAENVVDNTCNLECGKTQRKMIDLLKESVEKSSAIGERKIMNDLIKNMERQLLDHKEVSR